MCLKLFRLFAPRESLPQGHNQACDTECGIGIKTYLAGEDLAGGEIFSFDEYPIDREDEAEDDRQDPPPKDF